MAKGKVWVKPTARGQMPNGRWVNAGDPPFQVDEGGVSKHWMVKLNAKDAKEASEKAEAEAAERLASGDLEEQLKVAKERIAELEDGSGSGSKVEALEKELADTKAALEKATSDLSEAAQLVADMEKELAGKSGNPPDTKASPPAGKSDGGKG